MTTTKKTIDQETLSTLVENNALRELRAVREGPCWALEGRIGTIWLPVRSRREEKRLWRSLTAVERFCKTAGVKQLLVEL
ncbi:MAG: hypothetical protein WBR57_00820 [Pseudomonas sp.]